MPQYIKMRYGGERIRVYLTCLALMLSIFTKISVDLYSGAIFLQQALNWNLYASVIALILLAAFFTVGGGLTAVIWTDFIQTVIMVVSSFILMIINEIGCAGPDVCYQVCHSRNGCSDIAYPLLVLRLMPNAIRGLTLACMIAALMPSLTSIFNSSSTIFTIDIWQRFRRNAQDWELMIVGRVFVMILVGISILWISVIRTAQGARLFDYIQAISSFLAPPVAACYLLGILWKRINEEVIYSE
ncbi:unnamed protein product [Rotaria sp. Silwood1]|nr:unnamed protein product [Rotaria sp. Silwood1]CAF1542341.1 unnamed protein product [Rotaria sp. Silwood1]CAF1543290.1 unnamed protein product [Rotaria sp. Silwood1]CAF3704869.1 unnamed protein product [Rotaria sp. Silwood1]CAF5029358.1 unnamed protein product [Rotaria sp. Silwood1]